MLEIAQRTQLIEDHEIIHLEPLFGVDLDRCHIPSPRNQTLPNPLRLGMHDRAGNQLELPAIRRHALVGEVTGQLAAYEFGPAGQSIYAFLWDEYADW